MLRLSRDTKPERSTHHYCLTKSDPSNFPYIERIPEVLISPVPSEANSTLPSLLAQVLEWREAGFSTIPIATDGSKKPTVSWKPYQATLPSSHDVRSWWGNGHYSGLAVICGQVSGNVEMLELESRVSLDTTALAKIEEQLDRYDATEVWALIQDSANYAEMSPTGGYHFFYRISDHEVPGNQKVARRPSTPDELEENPDDRLKVLVETRGEGGYVIVAPTDGVCHPSGEAWLRTSGDYGIVPTITWRQRNALHAALRAALDEMPPEPVRLAPEPPRTQPDTGSGTSPGDDWEDRGDITGLLERHGWTYSHKAGEEEYWIRPGKSRSQGHSATWNYRGSNRFYVFSSAVAGFESEQGYSKFGVYAQLEHGGDYKAAAKALLTQGYGDRPVSVVKDIPEYKRPETATADMGDGPGAFLEGRLAEDVALSVLRGRFCWTEWGWYAWDGMKWDQVTDVPVMEVIRKYFLDWFNREISTGKCSDERRKLLSGLLSRNKITSVAILTKGLLMVRIKDFDTDPDILNTPTGVVNLVTGELMSHDPERLITKITKVGYDPEATHPDWDKALTSVPPEVMPWLKDRLGQAVTGHMPPRDEMIFCVGGGENGKTGILGCPGAALGSYYTLMPEQVLSDSDQGHQADIMPLRGARLAVLEELPTEKGSTLNTQRLKKLTTPEITARQIYKDTQTFTTTHTAMISSNKRPRVNETDHGTWRRLVLLNFPYKFKKPGQPLEGDNDRIGDTDLRRRLLTGEPQQRACLSWLVQGAMEWYSRGREPLDTPKRVASDSLLWREESDVVLRFWSERLTVGLDSYVCVDHLYQVYSLWIKEAGQSALAKVEFITRFMAHDMASSRNLIKCKLRTTTLGLSEPEYLSLPVPDRPFVIRGVAFAPVTAQ